MRIETSYLLMDLGQHELMIRVMDGQLSVLSNRHLLNSAPVKLPVRLSIWLEDGHYHLKTDTFEWVGECRLAELSARPILGDFVELSECGKIN